MWHMANCIERYLSVVFWLSYGSRPLMHNMAASGCEGIPRSPIVHHRPWPASLMWMTLAAYLSNWRLMTDCPLCVQVLYCAGPAIEALVKTGAHHYLEFKLIAGELSCWTNLQCLSSLSHKKQDQTVSCCSYI